MYSRHKAIVERWEYLQAVVGKPEGVEAVVVKAVVVKVVVVKVVEVKAEAVKAVVVKVVVVKVVAARAREGVVMPLEEED